MKAPRPRDVSELRSYLGLITYYSKFLPNMATLLSPLYELLNKGHKWHWSKDAEEAFEQSKLKLKQSQILAHFDPTKPLRLECDASPYGIGAVLSIKDGNDYRPVGFRSRTLSKAERNYAHLEKEGLALVSESQSSENTCGVVRLLW